MNTAEILTKAADVITERGWHKGDFVPSDSDPETAPVCAAAAINVAGGHWPNGHIKPGSDIPNMRAARIARNFFRNRLGMAIADWNDDPERTAEQVVTALREAARTAGSAS